MTPQWGLGTLWIAWGASWIGAAFWSDRSVARPGGGSEIPYRMLTVTGAILLIGFHPNDINPAWVLWRADRGTGWALVTVTLLGLLFTWWARIHLGRLWSRNVARKAAHHLVNTGPYALTRHPIYTGIILATLATAVFRGTVFAGLGFVCLTVGWYVKARLEERFLREQLGGPAYDAYAKRVPMLVPFARTSRPLAVLLVALLAPTVSAQTSPCPPLDTLAPWAQVNRAWRDEAGLTWRNDSLRQILLALAARDQAARADFGARATDTAYGRQLRAEDSSLALIMTGILDRFGLPTRSIVGATGADAGMLIVQHNWPLQERALALAQSARPGEISPQALAMLEDRVRVHQDKPQRYGTQFTLGADGLFHFAPESDPRGLDARRAAAGMPPMDQYVCFLIESGVHVDRTSVPSPTGP